MYEGHLWGHWHRPKAKVCAISSVCKGMLLRIGAGRVKHFSATHLCVQGMEGA